VCSDRGLLPPAGWVLLAGTLKTSRPYVSSTRPLRIGKQNPWVEGELWIPGRFDPAQRARPLRVITPAASPSTNCRLPVTTIDSGVGWLDVPGGTFKPDPPSKLHMSPIDSSIAWDPAIGDWVPTDPRSLSPDGARYVAPDTSTAIDIVDARSASTIAAIPPKYQSDFEVFFVLGYTPTAIYLGQAGKNPEPGLWKIDTSSWALSQVTSEQATWNCASGYSHGRSPRGPSAL
jgi:hypothetical protein